MICNCRICRASLTEEVNQLWETSQSLPTVLGRLENLNMKVTEKLLRKHLTTYGYDLPLPVSIVPKTEERLHVVLDDINFDDYNFNPNNSIEIISYLQKVHLNMYLKQLEIVTAEIIDYQKRVTWIPPTQSIKNLKTLWELLDESAHLSVFANQNAAIATVRSLGYDLKILGDIDVPNLPNNTIPQTIIETES